jgi:hypothetical protein
MNLPSRALKLLGVALFGGCCFAAGFWVADGDVDADTTSFHDMRVIPPEDLRALVDARDPAVQALRVRLETPENAYRYVRDQVAFEPSRPAGTPGETIADGAASCLGKAALLVSLYRSMGFDDGQVRVVTGQVRLGGDFVEHAWVELESRGACLQQDPSQLLGTFGFGDFKGNEYTRRHVRRELFCFNDKGFAVVSQLNRFR